MVKVMPRIKLLQFFIFMYLLLSVLCFSVYYFALDSYAISEWLGNLDWVLCLLGPPGNLLGNVHGIIVYFVGTLFLAICAIIICRGYSKKIFTTLLVIVWIIFGMLTYSASI